ncbi:MAG TPA: S8 family serine peptidase [Actinomycetota bacterium]|jgi:subtilisin family serine protease
MSRRVLPLAVAVSVVAAISLSTAGAASAAAPRGLRAAANQPTIVGAPIQAPKSVSGRAARSDRSLFHLRGSKLTPVMIKLDYDAVSSYAGGVRGYAATSPAVTHRSIAHNAAAVSAYQRYASRFDARVRSGINARISGVRYVGAYHLAYGGISALVPANRIAALMKVKGVAAVQKDSLLHPLDNQQTLDFLGAPLVWPGLGGQDNAGSNVIVANIDTGVWPENPLFADNGLPAPPGTYDCQFGDGSDPNLGPAFSCNNKLIGAYAFTDTYQLVSGAGPDQFCDPGGACSARDSDGHGTHTLSTAAGDRVDHAPIEGIDRGPVSGIAPGAHVIAYRVCLEDGCYESDSVAAVNQAIENGVNILNFSVSGGADPYSDAVELAFLDAYNAGIQVNASAGNAGPGAGTSDHGGAWVDTVAASTPPVYYLSTLHLKAGNGDTLDLTGSEITPGITSATKVVLASKIHGYDALCSNPLPTGTKGAGAIVACQRGNPVGRNADSFNVMQGGAVGMILFNPTHQDLFTDNFFIPTIMLDGAPFSGSPAPTTDQFLAFMAAHVNVHATWDPGTLQSITPDVVTTFSSRGPTGSWLKPTITAPGIESLAGNTPESIDVASGPNGELYQAIAGTSMSSPHAAGVAALVKAVHPDWTPGQITSALMTSAVPALGSDGVTPATPFEAGSGSIRADRAVQPTLTFDVPPQDYYDAATDPLHRVDLNLPSVDATTMPGLLTTTRTAENVSGRTQSFTASTTSTGGTITVSPKKFSIPAGGTRSFDITIRGADLPEGQYFGRITLAPGKASNTVVIPVAFVKTQGVVSVTNTCLPTTILKGNSTDCDVQVVNNSPLASDTSVSVTTSNATRLPIQNVDSSDPVDSSASGFTWSGTLAPAVAPAITSITPGGSPAGYLPLSGFGLTPQPGFGDETLANFGVPAFQYGHETYDTVGVDSNGYVVIGGGTSQDNDCCDPQTMPDPARPNNVVAPFWTDLNVAQGGAVYVGFLFTGSSCAAPPPDACWVVADWEGVPVFGTSLHQNFEVWIQLAGDSVTYAYGDMDGPDALTPMTAGAENRDGTSGANQAPAANSDFTVNDGSPTPGGTFDATYQALGRRAGDYTVTADVDSDQVKGTTSVPVHITVTKSFT